MAKQVRCCERQPKVTGPQLGPIPSLLPPFTGTSKFRGARLRTARRPQNRRNDMLAFCRAAAVCATKLGPLLLRHASVLRCGAVFIDEEVADGETHCTHLSGIHRRRLPDNFSRQNHRLPDSRAKWRGQRKKKISNPEEASRSRNCSPKRYFEFMFHLGESRRKYESNEV